ncbi:MAG: tetratricopeptide repeat protein [Immundisolibacter sp.]|uniref:tetratricopeptide repeat protein n=1 Tax=Immundisolibacter sp. TaxID=1934948 RepID=UPI003EDFF2B2
MQLRCPACSSSDLRPASAHPGDTWTQRKLSRAYRCRKCGRRSWRLDRFLLGLMLASILVLATPLLVIAYHLMWGDDRTQPAQTFKNATTELQQKANTGDTSAQIELARQYTEGDGVLANARQASRWYAQAAAAGDREGQYRFGSALLEGSGVVQDYRAALNWLKLAADKHHARAQFALGQMYYEGLGTPIDKIAAYVWLSLAAAQGLDDATRLRDQVLNQIPADRIMEAQERARELHARLSADAGTETQQAGHTGPKPKP